EPVDSALRQKYFSSAGPGRWEFKREFRQDVTFRRFNLMTPDYPFRKRFHVIFCRNVLIYFDGRTKAALIDRFADLLTPGGALYLGHSESLLDEHPLLESLGATVYRRRR
ncbi:MAG: CheR family methyltransferase, partial [Pseudomonadota bacterium]